MRQPNQSAEHKRTVLKAIMAGRVSVKQAARELTSNGKQKVTLAMSLTNGKVKREGEILTREEYALQMEGKRVWNIHPAGNFWSRSNGKEFIKE